MPDLRKVIPGQKLHTAFAAGTWNSLLDAAGANEDARHNMTRRLREIGRSPGIVRVLNDDSADWRQFVPVGLVENLFDATDDAFGETPAFRGNQIDATTKTKYAITLEPIPMGEIGLAVASGVVPCRLDSDADSDDAPTASANLTELSAFSLQPDSNGTAQILWREPGAGSGASAPWALIRIPRENQAAQPRAFGYPGTVINATALNTYYVLPFQDNELPPVSAGDVTFDTGTNAWTVNGLKKWMHHLHVMAKLGYPLAAGRTLEISAWVQWNTSIPASPFSWTVTTYPAKWALNQYWPPIEVWDSRNHHQISSSIQAPGRQFRVAAYITSNMAGAIDVDLIGFLNWTEVENQ